MKARMAQVARSTRSRLLRALPRSRAKAVETFESAAGAEVDRVDLGGGPLRPTASRPRIRPAGCAELFSAQQPAKFAGWAPFVATVDDARLVGWGRGVVDSSNRLVKASLWDTDHYRRDFRRRLPADDAQFEGTAVSLLTLWDGNYYHWLVDALPRLAVLRASTVDARGARFVVPDQMRPFHRDSLMRLGIDTDRQVEFDGSSLRLGRLVWPSPAAPIGYCTPFIVDWLRERLGGPAPVMRNRRIYVARRVRKVANEPAVWDVLAEHGFERVFAEDLTFAEQTAVFSQASLIVGPHGAGMVNAAFARDACVLEMFQPGYVNTGLFEVSKAAGHAYWAIVGTTQDAPGPSKDADMTIDVSTLRSALVEMEDVARTRGRNR